MSKGKANPSNIAICGIGCIFPQADDLEQYWDNIKKGVDSITDTPRETHWNADDYLDPDPKVPDMTYCARGGFSSSLSDRSSLGLYGDSSLLCGCVNNSWSKIPTSTPLCVCNGKTQACLLKTSMIVSK